MYDDLGIIMNNRMIPMYVYHGNVNNEAVAGK
jgi:hypothetical protein